MKTNKKCPDCGTLLIWSWVEIPDGPHPQNTNSGDYFKCPKCDYNWYEGKDDVL